MSASDLQFTFTQADEVLAEFCLGAGEYVIGRDAECQVVVDEEGVAPRHALLRVGEEVVLEDLKTGSGTFLNGVRIAEPVQLKPDHAVTFGECTAALRLGPHELLRPPPPEPEDKQPHSLHTRPNGLFSHANKVLFRKLSEAAQVSSQAAQLRTDLKERESALVEAILRRERAEEQSARLGSLVARLEQQGRTTGPEHAVQRTVRIRGWAAGFALLSTFGIIATLGSLWRTSHTRAMEAEAVVNKIKVAAPQFREDAQRLIAEGDFDGALSKISLALALEPQNPEHHVLEGHIGQSLLRIPQARQSFERALALDPSKTAARDNAGLCKRLLATSRGPASLESLYALHRAMMEQGRLPEALRMAQRLDHDRELLHRTWWALLEDAEIHGDLVLNDDGTFDLDLRGAGKIDLALLRDMPLRALNLSRSATLELRHLRGLSLRELDISETGVRDLSALEGMPLEVLNVSNTAVTNLFPLQRMPLRRLALENTQVSDLSALRGTRLEELRAAGTRVWNIEPLVELPLRKLDLARSRVSEIDALAHLPLQELDLSNTAVADLSPLAGAGLTRLDLKNTRVADLQPLSGSPLVSLDLSGCTGLKSVAPLASCQDLERLSVPSGIPHLDQLRKLPALRFLSHESVLSGIENDRTSEMTAAEFWARYDAEGSRPLAGGKR